MTAAPANLTAAPPPVEADDLDTAGQWRLIWRRFRKHRAAMVSGAVVLLFYAAALFAGFVSPYDPHTRVTADAVAPPTRLRFWDAHEGQLHLRPFIYGMTQHRDPVTRERIYTVDQSQRYPVRLFVPGDPYVLWGLFDCRTHLFGTDGPQRIYLFGADIQGRDLFSRLIYGSRLSLTIGLVGVVMSFTIGIVLGAICGYYGGAADVIIQRVIELIMSVPSLPLWMALSVAIPLTWSVHAVFFFITVILSLTSWTGMARVVRGKLLSLRDEEFVIAARLDGAGGGRIMFGHLIPLFLSHIIASATLSIPGMILGETALSFLGIGLRPPAISWGVLLKDAQNVETVALTPWLLIPGLFVVVIVLAFNFLGDGLRDAADPYG